MGVGGGGLLLIYLTLVTDMPQRSAQLANLVFFIFASAASLFVHVTQRKIPVLAVFLIASGGVLGAFVGSYIASATDPDALRVMFGAFLAVSGSVSLFRHPRGKDANKV